MAEKGPNREPKDVASEQGNGLSGRRELVCRAGNAGPLYTHNLFATVMDEVEEDILLMDLEGRIVDVNRNAHERQQMAKEDYVGRLCWELEGQGACRSMGNEPCPFRKTLTTREKAEALHADVGEDGAMRYFRIYTYPVFDEVGKLVNILEIRRDITRRTQMELRLRQSEKLAAIGELSTYIAHEIRNPLFAIAGFANALARSDSLDEDAKEKAGIILDESKRLDKILKSILNFARPTEAESGTVDLASLTSQTMHLFSLGMNEVGGPTLALEIDEETPLVKADPELLKQCFINLVKNGIEAMEGMGGGRLTVRTGLKGTGAYLSIADTGRGIPPQIRDKVFNPFFSTKDKGSGLGLAMTKKIVEDMGGRVELVSTEGEGTCVTLYLPPVMAVEPETPTPSESPGA